MEGFDEFKEELERLKRKAQELDGEHDIPFEELFSREFMRRYTDAESIEEFFGKSPWSPETEDEFDAIPEEDLDAFVDDHSRFRTWENMMGEAAEQWITKQWDS